MQTDPCQNLAIFQKDFQQIIEKALPKLRRGDTPDIPHQQAALLGCKQFALNGNSGQTGAFAEQGGIETFVQSQRIHHEFEG